MWNIAYLTSFSVSGNLARENKGRAVGKLLGHFFFILSRWTYRIFIYFIAFRQSCCLRSTLNVWNFCSSCQKGTQDRTNGTEGLVSPFFFPCTPLTPPSPPAPHFSLHLPLCLALKCSSSVFWLGFLCCSNEKLPKCHELSGWLISPDLSGKKPREWGCRAGERSCCYQLLLRGSSLFFCRFFWEHQMFVLFINYYLSHLSLPSCSSSSHHWMFIWNVVKECSHFQLTVCFVFWTLQNIVHFRSCPCCGG